MKKFLVILYSLLFLLFFVDSCLLSADSSVDFILDGDGKDATILLPESISICGVEIQSSGITLFDLIYKIIEQKNFIGSLAMNDKIDNSYRTADDYKKFINKYINLSATTVWAPAEYAGKTVDEAALMLKGLSTIESSKFIDNKIMPASICQSIKDKIKELNTWKPTSKIDVSNQNVSDTSSTDSAPLTSKLPPLPVLKKDKFISVSEQAGEWLFVFKAIYESFIGSSSSKILFMPILSTTGQSIGPKSKNILVTSIGAGKSYVEYLQSLLDAVKPEELSLSAALIIAPESINVNKEDVMIKDKNIQDVYNIVITEKGDKSFLMTKLKSSLQPEDVKQSFFALCAEADYCFSSRSKISEAISLFIPNKSAAIKKPQSFGDAWLANKNESKGTVQEIVIDSSSSPWKNGVDKLKECFMPKIETSGYYRLVPLLVSFAGDDQTLYAAEQAASLKKALSNKVASIIQSMNFKMDGNKKIMLNLYPAPIAAFNEAFDALYIYDENDKKYRCMVNGSLKDLKDSQNVDVVKADLLESFAGMDFGNIKINVGEQVVVEEALPDDLVKAMQDYIAKEKLVVKDLTMLKVFNNVTFPDGWMSMGPVGIQSPSGTTIPMNKVIEAVKTQSESGSGAIDQSSYDVLQKHLKGTPAAEDDTPLITALRAGKSYKEYNDMLANGPAPVAATGISKESYDDLLKQVQVEVVKKKGKAKLTTIIMTFSITQDYKDLKLPNDETYTQMLFTALMANKNYDGFIASDEYQTYVKDNGVSVTPPAAASVTVEPVNVTPPPVAVIVSKPLVDKAKYDELVVKIVGISGRPNFTAKSVKMALGLTDDSGIANNEEQFGLDKDKLAQALFDKKTFDEYVQSLGGSKAADEPVSVTPQPIAVVVLKPLVDKAKYDELLASSDSPRFIGVGKKAAGIKVGLFGSLGFAETVSSEDKDALAQALFDRKTYELYVQSLGGSSVVAIETAKIEPSPEEVQKIFDTFDQSMKISNLLLIEATLDKNMAA